MYSTSTADGRYFLTTVFEIGTNIDIAQVDVQNRVGRANKSLPAEVISYGITVKKSAPDMLHGPRRSSRRTGPTTTCSSATTRA